MGYAFESVCYKHITQIQNALKIPPGSRAGTWRFSPKRGSKDTGAQIDLLFERNDDVVTLCEIKCTNEPFSVDKDYYNLMLNKVSVYQEITKTAKQIFIAFISTNGIKRTIYTKNITGIVTLDDLIEG